MARPATRIAALALMAFLATSPAAAENDYPHSEPILPTGDVVLPVLIKKVTPYYPSKRRQRGQQGKVTLQSVVGVDGSVTEVTVLTSDHPEFTKAAIDAVKKWKYRPALLHGVPVAVYYTTVVRFTLRGYNYRRPSKPPAPPTPEQCYGKGSGGPSSAVDAAPHVVRQRPVEFPEEFEIIEGSVVLELEVCRNGRVRSARVVSESARGLGQLAAASALDWEYSPAQRGGKPVATLHRTKLVIKPEQDQ